MFPISKKRQPTISGQKQRKNKKLIAKRLIS